MKKILVIFILTFALATNASADDFQGLNTAEQAELAGAYLSEVIKYIKNNFVGKDIDVNQLMQIAIRGVVSELDEYSDYMSIEEYNAINENERSFWFMPEFTCDIADSGYPVISQLTSNTKAYQDGIRKGDVIRAIKGVSTYNIGSEEYFDSSTSYSAGTINMDIARGDKITNYDVNLVRFDVRSVNKVDINDFENSNQKFSDNTVGYIKITSFYENTSKHFEEALSELKKEGKTKLILDLRGNTGGYVDEAIAVARQIVPSGVIISTRDKKGNTTTYSSDLKTKPFEACVVLVDGITASSAEILASALQDSAAAKLVGEKTFGKGVMQSVTEIDGLGVIKMTTLEYYSRYGKQINGVGIMPDIVVDKMQFVSEAEPLDSKNVMAVINFLGFKIDDKNSVERNIGKYQAEMNLPVTYKLDTATVKAMNEEIYEDMINNDKTLTVGYLNLILE